MNKKQKRVLYRIIAAAVFLAAAYLLPTEGIWRFAVFGVPYLIIGYDVVWSALRNILRGEVFDERFLMMIATIGALAIGEYPEAVAVMLFYQVCELFQSVAVGKSRKSISALMDIRPDYAVVLRGEAEQRVEPDEVVLGEIIVIKPGEKIPLDGEIVEGETTLNTAALTC